MKLIIKEYLTLLRESDELDAILPELMLSMQHKILSKPQKGPRQYGIDLATFGTDDDGLQKVFLFTVKEGDIGRHNWDSGKQQDVRPSLQEIIDVYIPTHLPKKHSNFPIKIIVSTGGDLKQNIQLNWSQFEREHTIENNREFDFWGGDELAILIEKYLFNEHIIPKELRSKFRKTIALLNETDYDLRDYFEFLQLVLEDEQLPSRPQKKQLKSLRLIYLALNIIYVWSKEEDNLKHALLASERTILNVWNYLYKNNLVAKKQFTEIAGKIYNKNFGITSEYCEKLAPPMSVKDGLSMYGHDFLQESVILFEQLGILAHLGNLYYITGLQTNNENYLLSSKHITDLLKRFIENHKGLNNPVYDEHIIDVSTALFLLQTWGETRFVDEWIYDLISHIQFAYAGQGKYFPIDTDNFDDLVELNLKNDVDKEEFITTSTLIPILAQWCIKFGLIANYNYIQQISEEIYNKSTLQIWYPDESTENFMYTENAAYKSGVVDAPIQIPKEPKEMAKLMDDIHRSDNFIDIQKLSCIKHGIFQLLFISSRHFRMPIIPHIWNPFNEKKSYNKS